MTSDAASSNAPEFAGVTAADLTDFREVLRGFVASRVASRSDVDEIVQEVFLRSLRDLRSLREPDRLEAWLYRIARNAINDHFRRRIRRPDPVGLDGVGLEASTAESVTESDAELEFMGALSKCLREFALELPGHYSDALLRVDFDGASPDSVAQELGLSRSGLRSRVTRGRRALRESFERCCSLEFDSRGGVIGYESKASRSWDCPCPRAQPEPSN